ncbi:MAG: coproporphyrinogen III oxidase family protein [Gammaproteobacteria bacterium]|nr:coproporphyrinogen III oxidase family protein [Gammaproteobacteria bacterium]
MQHAQTFLHQAKAMLDAFNLHEVKASGLLPNNGNLFFPVVNYPPTIMIENQNEAHTASDDRLHRRRLYTGYLHIPFCPSRCTYCHWITKSKSKSNEVDRYIQYLIKEMQLQQQANADATPIALQSVLWGGGTPTYPEARQMETLLQAYHKYYDLSACSQFSVEAEPGTLIGASGIHRLNVMKDYGVDRISLGVQSFDNQILKQMGRSHTHEDTLKALSNMRKLGFNNIYIDLIYGYPGQTIKQWEQQLLQAVALDIDGFQLFRLRIKPTGARQGRIVNMQNKNPEQFLKADDIFLMKALGKIISESHGFYEFQRRIFSKNSYSSSHYLRDWFLKLYDIIGVGVSAWSQVQGTFSVNISDSDLEKYYAMLDKDQLPVKQQMRQSLDDLVRRSFILPLKNDVVDKKQFHQTTGLQFKDYFSTQIATLKQLDMLAETSTCYFLTTKGQFFADEVCTQFFAEKYQPFKGSTRLTLAQTVASNRNSQVNAHAD